MTQKVMDNTILTKRWIEFAPLSIPFSRRLETVSVIWFLLLWSTPFIGSYAVYYTLVHTSYWYLAIAYISWIIYDRDTPRKGGRRRDRGFGGRIWKWYANYFPIRVIKKAELDPSENYLIGYHPHGFLGAGLQGHILLEGNNETALFPGIKINVLTLDVLFFVPILRDLILLTGGCSVAKESINFLLSKKQGGNAVVIVPGGAREVLYSHPGTHVLYLKKRKGFIKVAIQNGSALVPMYTFGETDVYSQLPNPEGSWIRKYQDFFLKWFGIPPTLINGRGIFQYSYGILPRRVPLTSVVGAPIPVKQTDAPNEADVNEVHDKYITALTELFYAHRVECGHANSELTIT